MLLTLCYETNKLHQIDAIINIIIQELYFDIHFSYLIIEIHQNG